MSGRRLQITLQPEVLRWARERAKLQPEELANKMGVKRHEACAGMGARWGRISVAQVDKTRQMHLYGFGISILERTA